jgi:glycosyltransferase involved in cell wall biosynthesis
MNIAIEASSLARPDPTGVAAYGVNLIRQMASLDSRNQYYLCYRLSRIRDRRHFFRMDRPNVHVKIFQEPFRPRFLNHVELVHGLDARICRWKNVKKVVTIHDTLQYSNEFGVTRHPEKKKRRFRSLMRSADRIIADSEHTRRDILGHFPIPEEKIDVVPLGVEAGYRPMAREETDRVLERYRIQRPYLFYVGCIETRKNLVRTLEAFSRIRRLPETSGVRFVLAGKPGMGGEDVFRAVERLGLKDHVDPVGYVDLADLPFLYSGAEIFLFPSLYEGFGLPVLEAMACGTPVITSRTTSLPEVAGDAALLVDPEDTESIGEAMQRFLARDSLREEYILRGTARAGMFPWERTARNTLAVYEKTLKQA